jgi:hypothetical protein
MIAILFLSSERDGNRLDKSVAQREDHSRKKQILPIFEDMAVELTKFGIFRESNPENYETNGIISASTNPRYPGQKNLACWIFALISGFFSQLN